MNGENKVHICGASVLSREYEGKLKRHLWIKEHKNKLITALSLVLGAGATVLTIISII